MEAMIKGKAQQRLAAAKLREALTPLIGSMGISWADVLPVLLLVDTAELQAAQEDVAALLTKLENGSDSAALRMQVAKLRPSLEPHVWKLGLWWEEVLPALVLVESLQELDATASDGAAALDRWATGGGPVAKRLLVAKLRPVMEPLVWRLGLTWADAHRALMLVDAVDVLSGALQAPEAFLDEQLSSGSATGKWLTLAMLRPQVEPLLTKEKLAWEDAEAVSGSLPMQVLTQNKGEAKE